MKPSYHGDHTPTQIPLDRRLHAIEAGQICDDAVLNAKFRRIQQFPLKVWFSEHPERLEKLCQVFPDIRAANTFGQAAAILFHQLIQRKGEIRHDPLIAAGMWMLYSPLLDIQCHLCTAREGGAYVWMKK